MSSRGHFPPPKPSTASMVEAHAAQQREPASESAGRTNAAYAPEQRSRLPASLDGQTRQEPAVVLRGSLLDDAEVDGESTMTYSKRPSQPSSAVSEAPRSAATRPSVPVPRPRSVPPLSAAVGVAAPALPANPRSVREPRISAPSVPPPAIFAAARVERSPRGTSLPILVLAGFGLLVVAGLIAYVAIRAVG